MDKQQQILDRLRENERDLCARGVALGDTQKQVSQFPVRHCEFRTGLRPVPLDETPF